MWKMSMLLDQVQKTEDIIISIVCLWCKNILVQGVEEKWLQESSSICYNERFLGCFFLTEFWWRCYTVWFFTESEMAIWIIWAEEWWDLSYVFGGFLWTLRWAETDSSQSGSGSPCRESAHPSVQQMEVF